MHNSTSSAASRPSRPRYGAVSLTRCPDCPRVEPLKRLMCVTEKNGNTGRDFVKCESLPPQGQNLNHCGHFEWIDAYIRRLEKEGIFTAGAITCRDLGPDLGAVQNLGRAVEQIGDDELKGELKKINKQLRKRMDLKK